MNYLLIGIILFITFSLIITLLVSSSYRHLEKTAKQDPNSSMFKVSEDDILFNYLKHVNIKISSLITKNKEVLSKQGGFLNIALKAWQFCLKIFLATVTFISNVFEKIKPLKKSNLKGNSLQYDEYEEDFDSNLTNQIIDEPNIVLDPTLNKATKSRAKSIKQIQNQNTLTKEEFNKLESVLLHKIDESNGNAKFKIALELAALYNQTGLFKEQRELCNWIIEKGDESQRHEAGNMLISLN